MTVDQFRTGAVLFILTTAYVTPEAMGQLSAVRSSILLKGSTTTASRIYYLPDATSPDARSASASFNAMFGVGAEYRLSFPDDGFFLSISVEYSSIERSESRPIAYGDTLLNQQVREGIRFIPFEAGVYTFIPLGSDAVRLTMGGGIGGYYAARTLSVGEAGTTVRNTPVAAGIHVAVGVEYRIAGPLMASAGVRFRDPEVRCENAFTSSAISIGGVNRPLPTAGVPSRIQVDGMNFSLGILYELP